MTEMTAQKAKALREEFPASAIGKLPKSTCRACSASQRKRCDEHRWVSGCPECKGSHTSATIHLDYVGHAATTARLLEVDPGWTWEPLALGPDGLPALDRSNNLWIRLTICGVTRLGVGDGKSAKECIGDAIRNAAMRFGVALDLWAKEDLHEISVASDQTPAPEPERKAERVKSTPADDPWQDAPVRQPGSRQISAEQLVLVQTLMSKQRMNREDALTYVEATIGRRVESRNDLTRAEASRLIDALQKLPEVTEAEAGSY